MKIPFLESKVQRKIRRMRDDMQLQLAEVAKKQFDEVSLAQGFNRGADTGRRNRDWRPPTGSADLSWVPESQTILPRARDIIRNTWAGRAIANAYADNVVGEGIRVIPSVTDDNGNKISEINARISELWRIWCRQENCDVERTRTMQAVQESAIREWTVAGECFIVWSYQPDGASVGLKLQMLEADQLFLLRIEYGGNEVRGGIEVDADGAPVAYHFYQRNPNDLTYANPAVFVPVRIEAARCLHFFTPDRARQSRGVPIIAPVMQDIRDAESYRNATLMAARMQAAVGLIIQKNAVSNSIFAAPGYAGIGPLGPNEQSTTSAGVRTADFMPGMVFEGLPGEDIKPFTPGPIAQTYGPFMEATCREIAAGVGISYGTFIRHATGSYSATRQERLMDRRTWRRVRCALTAKLMLPIYRTWLRFAVMENQIPGLDWQTFSADPTRYEQCKFVADYDEWIDPGKDIAAAKLGIELGIMTRREIIEAKGGDFEQVISEIAEERRMAASHGIAFEEDVNNAGVLGKANTNIGQVIAQIESTAPGAPATPPVAPQQHNSRLALPLAQGFNADDPQVPPNYRPAAMKEKACMTCTHLSESKCRRYKVIVQPDYVCDDWIAGTTASGLAPVKGQPPGPPNGQEPIGRGDAFDNPQHNPAASNSY